MTITKEGALASFYTVNKAPIKHLRVYFSPKQAGEGDPSPENVREISGWDGIEVTHCSKNLYNPANVIMNQELYPAGDLYSTGTSNNWCVSDYMPVKPNTTYIATALLTKGSGRYALYDENKNYIRGAQEKVGANAQTIITTSADARYIRLTIRIGDKLNTIFEESVQENAYTYYPSQFHTLDWANDIGTVYGGYVDLITGELVEEWTLFEPNENSYITRLTNESFRQFRFQEAEQIRNRLEAYCSHYKMVANPNVFGLTGLDYVDYACQLIIQNTESTYVDTVDELKQWLVSQRENGTPFQIVFRRKNPITHQLTPLQLQTLLGRNNIWSNADRVEIEYDLAESNDELYRRRNILLRSAPHIETASGNFETDIAAPIKSAIVRFSPIQAGEGNPSPENIRPISGWTGLTAYHSGENLYVPNLDNKGYISVSGAINVDTTSTYTDLIPVTAGETYSFKCTTVSVPEGTTNRRLHGYDSNGNWVMQITNRTTAAATVEDISIVVTIPSGVSYIRASFRNQDTNVRIAKENAISVNWSTEAGTIYGGYVDLVNGELVETYKKYNLGDLSVVTYGAASYDGDNGTNAMYIITNTGTGIGYPNGIEPIGDKIVSSGKNISGYYIGTWTNPDDHIWEFCINANNQLHVVFDNTTVGITSDMTFAQRRTKITEWLQSNPIIIVAPLETPIIYSLTSSQLKTFRGANTIWSTANGNIELSYWTH